MVNFFEIWTESKQGFAPPYVYTNVTFDLLTIHNVITKVV